MHIVHSLSYVSCMCECCFDVYTTMYNMYSIYNIKRGLFIYINIIYIYIYTPS